MYGAVAQTVEHFPQFRDRISDRHSYKSPASVRPNIRPPFDQISGLRSSKYSSDVRRSLADTSKFSRCSGPGTSSPMLTHDCLQNARKGCCCAHTWTPDEPCSSNLDFDNNPWGFCTFYLLTTENGVSLPLQLCFPFGSFPPSVNHVTGSANEIICLQKVFSSLLRLSTRGLNNKHHAAPA